MRRRLVVACALAVALALPALAARVSAEQRAHRVDLAVADSAVRGTGAAGATGGDAADPAVLDRLAAAGVGSVVVGMRSIRRYVDTGDVTIHDPASSGAGGVPPALAGPGPAAVLSGRPGDPGGEFARIVAVLRAQFGGSRVTATRGGQAEGRTTPFVRVNGVRDVGDVSIRYDAERLRAIEASGLRVVLALPARVDAGRGWLTAEVERAATLTGARTVLALGPLPFLTRPDDRTAFRSFLAARGLRLALPDLELLPGAAAYGAGLPGRVVRTHVIPLAPGSDVASTVVRSHRAEKERGVRLLLLRPRSTHPDAQLPRELVDRLVPRLTQDLPGSLRMGAPTPAPAVEPGVAASLSVLAAGLVLLACMGGWAAGTPVPVPRVRRSPRSIEVVRRTLSPVALGVAVAAAGLVGVLALVTDRLFPWQLLTLAVAAAGATLAVLAALGDGPARGRTPRPPTSSWRGLLPAYALGVGIAMATGIVVAGLGSRTVLTAGLVPFLGVKALLLAPPLLVGLYALLTSSTAGLRSAFSLAGLRTGLRSVRPTHVVLGVLVLGAAAYYLVRSGNSGIAPGFELWVRDHLDEAMYVRPRFKEALLGLPALVLALSWRSGAARWVCAMVAAVGTASMVDTFAHFHLPVAVAVLRSAYAVVIGLALGLAARWVVDRVRRGGGRDGRSREERPGSTHESAEAYR